MVGPGSNDMSVEKLKRGGKVWSRASPCRKISHSRPEVELSSLGFVMSADEIDVNALSLHKNDIIDLMCIHVQLIKTAAYVDAMVCADDILEKYIKSYLYLLTYIDTVECSG